GRGERRQHEEPHALVALQVDRRRGGEDDQLRDPERDEIRRDRGEPEPVAPPEFPADGGRRPHADEGPTCATTAASGVRCASWMEASGALSTTLPEVIMVT